jgi:hypothetical protein
MFLGAGERIFVKREININSVFFSIPGVSLYRIERTLFKTGRNICYDMLGVHIFLNIDMADFV